MKKLGVLIGNLPCNGIRTGGQEALVCWGKPSEGSSRFKKRIRCYRIRGSEPCTTPAYTIQMMNKTRYVLISEFIQLVIDAISVFLIDACVCCGVVNLKAGVMRFCARIDVSDGGIETRAQEL